MVRLYSFLQREGRRSFRRKGKACLMAFLFMMVPAMVWAQTTPTVKTSYATDLTPSAYNTTDANTTFSVNVFVDLVENGSSSATAVGLVWSTSNANPTLQDVDNGATRVLRNNTALGSSTVSLSGLPFNRNIYVRAFATNASGTAYGEVMTLNIGGWTFLWRNINTNLLGQVTSTTFHFLDARTIGNNARDLTTFIPNASIFQKVWVADDGGYNNLPRADFKLARTDIARYITIEDDGFLGDGLTPNPVAVRETPSGNSTNGNGWTIDASEFAIIRRFNGNLGTKRLVYSGGWMGSSAQSGRNVLCPVASAQYWDTKPTISHNQGKDSFCTTDPTEGENTSSYSRTAGKYYEFYIIKGHESSSSHYTTFVNENGTPTTGNGNFSLTPYAGFTEEWTLWNDDDTPYTGNEVTIQGNKVTYVSYFPTETKLRLRLKTTSTKNPDYFYEDPAYKEITFYPQSAPTSIEASVSYMTLLVDQAKTFTYDYESLNTPCPYLNITATSNDQSIATVQATSNGFEVTGMADGTTTITITALHPNGTEACSYDVTVEVTSEAELEDHGTGIVDNVVYLDDREDHSWSYYSDHKQPIRSLNPADVRIVYFGNGRKNMTNASETGPTPASYSANAEGVQVNVGEPQNTYYYIKTLERTDGATADTITDATGRCEYTTIPNPFQVRPTGESGSWMPATRNIKITTSRDGSRSSGWDVSPSAMLTVKVDGVTKATITSRTTTDISDIPLGSSVTLEFVGTTYYEDPSLVDWDGTSASEFNGRCRIAVEYDNGTQIFAAYNPTGSGNANKSFNVSGSDVEVPYNVYRGFYKWRVKKVYGGTIYNAATGGNAIGKGGIINADQTVWFEPTDENSMRVELEALWAEAYVNSNTYVSNGAGGDANYQCAYERNFKVATSGDLSTYTYPVTISTLYPNATTGTPSSRSMSANYTCSNDVKLENMTITNGGSRTLNANGKNLVVGRGVTGTVNNLVGLNGNSSTGFRMRVESGTYHNLSFLGDDHKLTAGKLVAVFGSDYDRANLTVSDLGDNTKLRIDTDIIVGHSTSSGNCQLGSTAGEDSFHCTVKSGNFDLGTTNYAGERQFYLSIWGSGPRAYGKRTFVVEGGIFSDIAGGMEDGINPAKGTKMVDIRIKGGMVNSVVYGAAQRSGAQGDRRMVFTGGTIRGWIAGGCNGTSLAANDNGELEGSTYIYFGGNAQVLQSGDDPFNTTNPTDPYFGGTQGSGNDQGVNGAYGGYIFGAGCGINPTNQTAHPLSTLTVGKVFGSTIVIADSCVVGRDIYGGGNFGFVGDKDFGGTDNNTDHTARIYVLGGAIHGDVNGGSNEQKSEDVEIYIRGGELLGRTIENPEYNDPVKNKIDGDVYGGCDTWGTTNGTANIMMTGGTVHGNVFGGGFGANTDMKGDCAVTIKGGLVMTNVYGGGNEGTSGKTSPVNVTVNIMGGKVLGDVYGGALGLMNKIHVVGVKTVNIGVGADGKVSSENCYIGGSVYGGSRRAADALTYTDFTSATQLETAFNNLSEADASRTSSYLNIASGYIQYHVFGSGFFGKTFGSTKVFIGQNAINNAPDHKLPETTDPANGFDAPNILRIEGNVYGGADYGQYDGTRFGDPTIAGYAHIYIDGLGYNTQTNVATADRYMNLGGSVYGCGTSCYSGKLGSDIFVRNYGYAVANSNYDVGDDEAPYQTATRTLQSLQFASDLIIENSNIQFVGQGKINSLSSTEKYSFYEISNFVRVVNGSGLFLDYPVTEIKALGSYSSPEVYAATPTYTTIGLDDLSDTDNKIRVNNGSAIYVYRSDMLGTNPNPAGYGQLEGFFHLMNDDENVCYLYARPRQSSDSNNIIADTWNNANDGGYVSYFDGKNTYSEGDASDTSTAPGHVDANGKQIPYENHAPASKGDSEYFRIWQYRTGLRSTRDGVFDAHVASNNTYTYSVAEVVIELPACVSGGKYRIKKDAGEGGYIYIDYGDDVMTFNAANTVATGRNDTIPNGSTDWMSFNGTNFVSGQTKADVNTENGLLAIDDDPDLRFGLVMIPAGGLLGDDPNPALVYNSANSVLRDMVWENEHPDQNPQMRFLLTYSNALQANAALDPITIIFEQYTDEGGTETIIDEVEVKLQVVTSTSITQLFETEVYAFMKGKGTADDTYTARVTFPQYEPNDIVSSSTNSYSEWTLESVTWRPSEVLENDSPITIDATNWLVEAGPFDDVHKFAMTCVAGLNSDNQNGWERTNFDEYDSKVINTTSATGNYIASSFGRNPASIEFTLHYNGAKNLFVEKDVTRDNIGYLEFHFNVTNCKDAGAPSYIEDVQVNVQIMRVGQGRSWYIDGVNGDNSYPGQFPNQPMKTLGAILSHTEYQPGDDIYILNEVSTGNDPLTWSGWDYDGITLYRYPGGHALADSLDARFVGIKDYRTVSGGDTPSNAVPYTGTLVNVTSDMTMQMITLDGSYGSNGNNVESSAPLITVADGCTLTMVDNTTLQNNYNESGNGGAIVMGENTTLNMDRGATIENNRVGTGYEGGGVCMSETSTMNVDHEVTVHNNYEGTGNNSQSNVYLPAYSSVVNLGEHLDTGNSTIGVTKTEFFDPAMDQLFPYTPVAYSDFPKVTEDAMANVIKDDMNRYSIEIYEESHLEYPSYYDYFLGTWFSAVTSNPGTEHIEQVSGTYQIKTDEGLAWAISIVNGRTTADGGDPTTANPNANFTLVNDIDMSDNIWVPIGNGDHPYTGTFDGNGHAVTGLQSPLYRDDMGMFGQLGEDAEVKNVMAQVEFRDGNMTNIGSIAGTMADGATISNCEGGGTLKGNAFTENIGGLVGKNLGGDIKNSFAVNDIIAEGTTIVGGLVGSNGDGSDPSNIISGGDIINNFANPSFQVAATVTAGGLAGVNYGLIENCYSRLRSTEPTLFGWFAGVNASGHTIQYCYAPVDKSNYVYDNQGTLRYHSNYAPTDAPNRKYKYAHRDQDVTVVSGNSYIENGALDYDETTHVVKIKGLLATLNNWVAAKGNNSGYSTWTRTMASPINDDYPVHTMDNMSGAHFNCVGSEDGVFLLYDDNVNDLWEDKGFKDMTSGAMYMFDVQPVVSDGNDPVNITGNTNVPLYIHENVGITQADDAELTARVGITFDNSSGNNLGGKNYDWHMFSSPLADAPLGIEYTRTGDQENEQPIAEGETNLLSTSYYPSTTTLFANYDFYAYDEPSRHWINLKRNTGDHWHQTSHERIDYTNENNLIQGKGYMMAIKDATMLMADGTLTNGDLTNGELKYTTTDYAFDIALTGVNLIGNPYQSYLDMPVFMEQNADNVDVDAYYVIDADEGGYTVHPNTGSENPLYAPAYLHPHQGFLVTVKESAMNEETHMGSVTFTNAMRKATGGTDSYFRGEKVNYPLVNLICTDASGRSDLTTVEMNRPELGGARKLKKMRTGDASLYAHFADNSYQALFAPKGVREVPVRLDVASDGVYTITWSMFNGEFHYVHLIDNMTGADIDMLTNNEYRIEASTEDYTSRFRLIFDVTGDEAPEPVEGPTQFAFFDGNSWVVTGQGTLQLFDVNGRCLMSTNVEGAQSSVALPNVAAGVYMFRLSNNQNTQVQKIVVK